MKKWNKIKCLAVDVDGVMTDGRIFMDANGNWSRFFFIRDGLGLVHLKEKGFLLAIITSSLSPDIQARAKNLKVDHFFENIKDKASAFRELGKKSGLKLSEIAYIGDDVIDLPVFELCGIAIAPKDAHAKVLKKADWITKNRGGQGAVREICDLLIERARS